MQYSDYQHHEEARQAVFDRYGQWINAGTFKPLVYPAATYPLFILLLFLLVPPTSRFHCRLSRYLTFAAIFYMHTWMTLNFKATGIAGSYGIGVIFAWGSLWGATLLVFTDAKSEFKRLERRVSQRDDVTPTATSSALNHAEYASNRQGKAKANGTHAPSSQLLHRSSDANVYYVWQAYPTDSFRHRFLWCLELVCSFRGIGWSWCIPGTPSLPPHVREAIKDDSTSTPDIPLTRSGLRRYDTTSTLLRHNAFLFLRAYLTLDLLRLLALHDPYFYGLTNPAPPAPPHLPSILHHPIPLRILRLTISLLGVWQILTLITSLGPLFFTGLLGPGHLGLYAEPYLQPDQYGSASAIFTRGLAGFWGAWWHQMFRYAFESAGRWVVTTLHLDPRSTSAKTLQLFTAFAVSGLVHAGGAVTALGDTMPMRGPFAFFLMQAVGILLQTSARRALKACGLAEHLPIPLARLGNFVYTFTWLYFTGPLFADDVARGAVWLAEYVPVSVLGLLGFGDGRVLCGRFGVAGWHWDRNPLLTGLAL